MAYSYDRQAATAKHQAVIDGLVEYVKTGPFKSYLRVKSVGARKLVLIPQSLNDQVTRVEISGLLGDKAEFSLFLQNGDSGWAWDEWRQPPKFHNDAGHNVLHLDKLDRIANPQTDPEKFEQHMLSFFKGALIPAIQRAGWVIDPTTKKPMPLAQWLLKQPQKPTPATSPAKIDETALIEDIRALVVKAIKRIGDGVRSLGLGSIVKYNPQEKVDVDLHGIQGTYYLRIDHPQFSTYHPGINFYWYKEDKLGSVEGWGLIGPKTVHDKLPLNKMADAMFDVADDILRDIKHLLEKKTQDKRQETDQVWSVVTLGKDHGYATDVEIFGSKDEAEERAKNLRNVYVVKGTQMWNEPLGQVEEHDRDAPSKFFR